MLYSSLPSRKADLLHLPNELLIEVLCLVERPHAIHAACRSLREFAQDDHYKFRRMLLGGKHLSVWAALSTDPKGLSVDLLEKLLANGAVIPRSWHQLLTQTESQRTFLSPAGSKLFALLSQLPFETRVRIVKWSRAHYNTSLLDEEDDQKFFESIFGMLGRWNQTSAETTKRLFELKGYVPLNGFFEKGKPISGSLESAFESSFVYHRDHHTSTISPTPLETLLDLHTIQQLLAFDTTSNTRRTIVSSAFATAGTSAAGTLLSSGLFSDMQVDAFESLLRLDGREESLETALDLLRKHTRTDEKAIERSLTAGIESLFGSVSSTVLPEDIKTFAAHHASLARFYQYFQSSPDKFAPAIATIENVARYVVIDIFGRPRAPSVLSSSDFAHTRELLAESLYTAFGPSIRLSTLQTILNHFNYLLTSHTPLSFASWKTHATVLVCMDPSDLNEIVRAVQPLIPSEGSEKRTKLRMDGFPLRIFDVGVMA